MHYNLQARRGNDLEAVEALVLIMSSHGVTKLTMIEAIINKLTSDSAGKMGAAVWPMPSNRTLDILKHGHGIGGQSGGPGG